MKKQVSYYGKLMVRDLILSMTKKEDIVRVKGMTPSIVKSFVFDRIFQKGDDIGGVNLCTLSFLSNARVKDEYGNLSNARCSKAE